MARTKAKAKALGDQYLEWQQPQRQGGRFAWLSRLLHWRPSKKLEEPQPARPAFR